MNNDLIWALVIVLPIYTIIVSNIAFKRGRESQEPRIAAMRDRQERLVVRLDAERNRRRD
jgi:hypothetical protein